MSVVKWGKVRVRKVCEGANEKVRRRVTVCRDRNEVEYSKNSVRMIELQWSEPTGCCVCFRLISAFSLASLDPRKSGSGTIVDDNDNDIDDDDNIHSDSCKEHCPFSDSGPSLSLSLSRD